MPKKQKKYKFDIKILYDYIQEKYDITKLPKHFFIKMANIFKGDLDGMLKPIPPEHLYDMWVQKMNYLNKVYYNNQTKGKKMDSYVRVNYDLAILISKYDNYLKWLDRQKTLEQDNEIIKESVMVTDVLILSDKNRNNNKKSKNNFGDVSDILDELI
jgi:hypothetical protein